MVNTLALTTSLGSLVPARPASVSIGLLQDRVSSPFLSVLSLSTVVSRFGGIVAAVSPHSFCDRVISQDLEGFGSAQWGCKNRKTSTVKSLWSPQP